MTAVAGRCEGRAVLGDLVLKPVLPQPHLHGGGRPSSGMLLKTALALEADGSEAQRISCDFVPPAVAAAFNQHRIRNIRDRKSSC